MGATCRKEHCKEPAEPGHRLCLHHLQRHRVYVKRHVGEKTACGFCLWGGCYKRPKKGHRYCAVHRRYFAARSRRLRKAERVAVWGVAE